jgi:Ni,Fe-hydrogenase I cytochrome b subunit
MASNVDIARLPIPGNAEFALFLLVWLVLTLIWLFSDEVGAGTFATLTVALTFAYLISRGIAKAGRVLEH